MIGILSGAGPLAGVDVAKKIIEETVAVTDQDHLPMFISSVPADIPDRTQFLLGRSEANPAYGIAKLFLHLESCGATVAALACNTAHAQPIFEVVESALAEHGSRLNVLHIVRETVRYLSSNFGKGTKVGVLSTSGTKKIGLYRISLQEAGFEVIEADEREQDKVQDAIYNPDFGIKAQSSPVHPAAGNCLREVMAAQKARGAQVLILGCTELPLAIDDREFQGVPIVDPNRLLARALIYNFDPAKLKI